MNNKITFTLFFFEQKGRLNVSVTYFYAEDDQEAELLLVFAKLSRPLRDAAVEHVRALAGDKL